jgi:co-chaperonin GroES (HSP10)
MNKKLKCRPVGHQILVRLLDAKEILDTKLYVQGTAKTGTPQACIVAFGNKIAKEAEEYGLKKGDRVILVGNYVPVPETEDGSTFALTEIHTIKGILE